MICRQAALSAAMLGVSGRVSEVVIAKRGISKAQAKVLANFSPLSSQSFI